MPVCLGYREAGRGLHREVTVSDGDIFDIEPDRIDLLMIISQDSCRAFGNLLAVSPPDLVSQLHLKRCQIEHRFGVLTDP